MELIIAAIGLIVAILGGGYFTIIPVVDRTRRDFYTLQPDVRIGGVSIHSSEHNYAAHLKLHNLGKNPAYDGTVTLDGWPGKERVPVIHPLRPGYNEYEVSLELGQDSPICTTKMDTARLQIRYRDRWDYCYELSYPVVQTPRSDGRFNIQIQMNQPTLARPTVSFCKMRKHLRETLGSMSQG